MHWSVPLKVLSIRHFLTDFHNTASKFPLFPLQHPRFHESFHCSNNTQIYPWINPLVNIQLQLLKLIIQLLKVFITFKIPWVDHGFHYLKTMSLFRKGSVMDWRSLLFVKGQYYLLVDGKKL